MKIIFIFYIMFTNFFSPILSKPNSLSRLKRAAVSDPTQSCDSLVYCQGSLLDTVQRARLFPDSKTFVDLSQINSEEVTLQRFNELMGATNNNPTRGQLLDFVNSNFENSTELEDWTPKDYTSDPALLKRIRDKEIKQFAADLVNIWPSLGRKVQPFVASQPEKHSIIYVPNGFIIPGGRFKEFYYWDSYWIIKGLLLSEMVQTAKGQIENLLHMVDKYGFVPNGGRVYYLNRSQPPLLTLMAALYLEQTEDITWIIKNTCLLDKELTYWIENKTTTVQKSGRTYKMAHYISPSITPRPESYYEDLDTCSYFIDLESREHCYQGLKSGAESGWDFSSRWLFDQQGGAKTNLSHIDAQRVIPVDLNAFLCVSFEKLSSFYDIIGDAKQSAKWLSYSKQWLKAIEEVLYDKEDGIWYDFDLELFRPRKLFFPSNFAPLWTESYNPALKQQYGRKAADYFTSLRIGEFRGGIPTSLDDNNEQWDLPNAWPPLQEFIILGLWNTGNFRARRIARRFAERWIEANLKGFKEENAMFEKYDATRVGQYGGGGEYEVQKGFGWTNGVALGLIDKFYTGRYKDEENEV